MMYLPAGLTPRQAAAAETLLGSTDFVSVLVGDAGTGKTTVLTAIEHAHRRSGGKPFVPLAPTTRAREALVQAGFKDADTVQRFMVSDSAQAQARGRVLLIDEAGLLSTEQLDMLTRIAEDQRARILLVGDIKQHYSVQRGDALRNVIRHTNTPVVRLSEVLRQRHEVDRQFSRLLASGRVPDAFEYADRRGLIEELGADHLLFATAAAHYADNIVRGIETLVVIPFWEEIDRFNVQAREELRRRGRLGEVEVQRESIHPLPWSEEQKVHWNQYTVGDRLLFVRDTRFFERGSMATVTEILPNGLNVAGDTRRAIIDRKQRGCFDVGRLQVLSLAAGDRLLIRGRDPKRQFSNGDFKDVASVDPATNTVILTDGTPLPADFKAWSYGHALTSYRSQGSTAEESLLVLGEVAERALMRRQFYVGNTRYRGAHRIYVTHRETILTRLRNPDPGRELATEFMEQHGLKIGEAVTRHRLHRVTAKLRRAWLAMEQRWRQSQDAQRQET
jgi:ATP-dependent exoDNAse (exonuclease V) alpha subunit